MQNTFGESPASSGFSSNKVDIMVDPKAHRFGGNWTDEKLEILGDYLRAYTTALKKQRFKTGYIDAFAGTGYRSNRAARDGDVTETLFDGFPDLAGSDSTALRDGSARIALNTIPRFDAYVFIERSSKRCRALAALRQAFPDRAADITIARGEGNEKIRDLCSKNWQKHRAVMFLDPYGMQVEWATIEAIARTKAVDLWLLFPLGIGVNRLVTRDGDIPPAWRERLNVLLGTEDWFEEFYRVEAAPPTLFDGPDGPPAERMVKASTEVIGRYFNNRLKTVFAKVSEQPRVLRNSTGCPLYLLCFAAANPKGADIAVGIADHLLQRTAV